MLPGSRTWTEWNRADSTDCNTDREQLSPERSGYDEPEISSEHIHPSWQLWHQMKEPGFVDEPA